MLQRVAGIKDKLKLLYLKEYNMPLISFVCPNGKEVLVKVCLTKCPLGDRCMSLPTLKLIAESDRPWTGKPSTTQLLNGTMLEWLKITQPYSVDPQNRAFALLGTIHHSKLSQNFISEVKLGDEITGTFDLIWPEPDGRYILYDYKTWGSYRVAKALGLVKEGKGKDARFSISPTEVDLVEEQLQLNHYRLLLAERGVEVSQMLLQITVRDGGTFIASSRGITKNIYIIPIVFLEDAEVKQYFRTKADRLLLALEFNQQPPPCNNRESWDGRRCKEYCEVANYCPKGILEQRGGI